MYSRYSRAGLAEVIVIELCPLCHVFVNATASLQPRMEVSHGLNTQPGSAAHTLPNGDYTSSKGDTERDRRLISSPEGTPILVFPGSTRFKFVKACSLAQTDHFLSLNALQSELKPLVGVQVEFEHQIFNLNSETDTSLDDDAVVPDPDAGRVLIIGHGDFKGPEAVNTLESAVKTLTDSPELARALLSTILELVTFPILLYILAPFVAFLELFLEIWVLSPYRAIIFVADALYPTYVFLGMACITGALLGLVARYLVRRAVAPPTPPPSETQDVKPTHTRAPSRHVRRGRYFCASENLASAPNDLQLPVRTFHCRRSVSLKALFHTTRTICGKVGDAINFVGRSVHAIRTHPDPLSRCREIPSVWGTKTSPLDDLS
ncbi:hypothetical protein K438DRAFT_2110365 [Mycena galopus ATCC 62051]|nr:hypothetical protein K438DRAFT_2110365 [Mycena galopus ATCC 62051]